MKLSRIKIAGFRGVRGQLDLELSSGFTVISGRNGAGKSTICDAIEYVLSGDIRRGSDYSEASEGYEDYIPWQGDGKSSEGTYVQLYFLAHDGQEFVVQRDRRKGLSVNSRNKDSEEALVSMLCEQDQAPDKPLNRLCQTSIIRDELITELSVEVGERNRYKFVRRALGTDIYANTVDRTRRVRDKLRKSASKLEKERDDHQSEVRRIEREVEEIRQGARDIKGIQEAENFIRRKLVSAEVLTEGEEINRTELINRSRRLTVELREDADELARALSQYIELQSKVEQFQRAGADAIEDLKEDLLEIRERIGEAEANKEKAEARLESFRRSQPDSAKLAELHSLGEAIGLKDGTCPLCGEPHTLDDFEARLRALRKKIDSIVEQIDQLKGEIDRESHRLDELTGREEEIKEEIEQYRTRRVVIARRVSELSQRVADITGESDFVTEDVRGVGGKADTEASTFSLPTLDVDALEKTISERRKLRTAIDEATTDLEASLAHERLDPLESKLSKAKERAEEIEKRLRHARAVAEKADKVRIRVEEEEGKVHKDRIEKLTPLLAEFYSRLRPHVDWKHIETKIRGNIQLYLRFAVGEKNPSFFFSSGQRRAVGLAFLLSVHLGCTWSRLRTLILDDPVQHIDDFRALQLTEALSAIRRTGRQVVVTVEDEPLARLLRRRLRSSEEQEGQHIQMTYDSRYGVRVEKRQRIAPMPRNVLEAA